MSQYKLAKTADVDFEKIFEYGLDNYGRKSAIDYQNNLTRHFEELPNSRCTTKR